jgi:hypothetical protein
MVIRGLDTDDAGILEAEQRIKQALPEHQMRALTVLEFVYDDMYHRKPPPFLAHKAVPEHFVSGHTGNGHRRRKGSAT